MWIALIKKFWPAIPGALLAFWLSLMLHNIDARFTKLRHAEEMASQSQQLTAQCAADKHLTEEVSNDYQTRLGALNRQLADARRVRVARCVVPATDPTGGRDAPPGAGEPIRPHVGVATDALLDYAAEAERYRLQLLSCQEFVRRGG